MRLTQLEIENFKCIGERQTIDIKPITLLFGPNSAGKSTVFHALLYLRKILSEDLNQLERPNGGINLSEFKSLVYRQDLQNIIRIKARIKLNQNFREEMFPINSYGASNEYTGGIELEDIQLNYNAGEKLYEGFVDEVGVAVEVAWGGSGTILKRIEIEQNKQVLLTISPKTYKASLLSPSSEILISPAFSPDHELEINFEHALLQRLEDSFRERIELDQSKSENVHDLSETREDRDKRRKEALSRKELVEGKVKRVF